MCASCGCGTPNDQHGDPRNITLDQINQAAAAAKITPAQAAQNMMACLDQNTSGTLQTGTLPEDLDEEHRGLV